MRRTALLDNTGLTLVEVLTALVVLLLVFLALMQTALISIDANMINVLRDEAIGIAEMRMSSFRSMQFNTLGTDSQLADTDGVPNQPGSFVAETTTQRDIRNIKNVTFISTRRIDDLDGLNGDNKQVDINVAWTWKGQNYSHTISTILRRQ